MNNSSSRKRNRHS